MEKFTTLVALARKNKSMVATLVAVLVICILVIVSCSHRGPIDPIYNSSAQLQRSDTDNFAQLRNSQNPQHELTQMWGNSLEDRIRADFERRGLTLDDNATIQLLQMKEDTQVELDTRDEDTLSGLVRKGELFVKIKHSGEQNGIYALACLNGMIRHNADMFTDRGMIRNYPFQFTVQKGNGFTQVLSNADALQAAEDLGLPITSNRWNESVVIIQPGYTLLKSAPDVPWTRVQ